MGTPQPPDPGPLDAFVARWSGSSGAERANKDLFLSELCDVLGVPRPEPTTGDFDRDLYVFERDSIIQNEDGKFSTGHIDLYKDACFLLEAKQGSALGAKKAGTARRETGGWSDSMRAAFGQAFGYARTLTNPPPFILVVDIGYCFDVYATFDGSINYRPFPRPEGSRLFFKDLASHVDTLRRIWTEPMELDPSRNAARVTREIASHLAELARSLEAAGHGAEESASFLMRALFTMFAEDAGLLPKQVFTRFLEDRWVQDPSTFVPEIEQLWKTMETGGHIIGIGKIRRFNGGFFRDHTALPLTQDQLRLLRDAAQASWTEVEPAIFGTLLERALDPKERHALGAHFTPRAYVERLVRPTIEEPLWEEWDLVRAQVHVLVGHGKVPEAQKVLKAFHGRLCHVRILDPACGTGNFLYVALDMLKRMESEVLGLLQDLGEAQGLLNLHGVTVSPAQLLGIEINPRAREIAELVLWIGFLRWQYGSLGKGATIPEPVLHDYGNIECRDAVLAYDRVEPLLDEKGQPVTRWDGETTKTYPVTGEQVPDDEARVPVVKYVNPRKAEWPAADFVVGNPPFLGNKRMRTALGDGYVEALRAAHEDVPETIDLVMYWWNHAAQLVGQGKVRRSGLITTNSITQTFNRRVVAERMLNKKPVSIAFAVPDHPWVESADGAAVRVAMTVVEAGRRPGRLLTVSREIDGLDGEVGVELRARSGLVNPDVSVGAAITTVKSLSSNRDLCLQGCKLVGDGFLVTAEERGQLLAGRSGAGRFVPRYVAGKDITQYDSGRYVVDFYGLTDSEARETFPEGYQRLQTLVKPERDQNKRDTRRRNWWIFGENAPKLRRALIGLSRFIATSEVAKHRIFVFCSLPETLADGSLAAIASDDAWVLGILSCKTHVAWAQAAGGRMGVANDLRYQNGPCFLPFPFPVCTDEHADRIRELGERLDAHRKKQQALHPTLTITGMYNVLEKLRSGQALTAKEKVIHEQGLVSILRQIHDDLDAAVFDAYGWPAKLTDEEILERLVALNAERAEEEKRGLVRWLRPEFQNPAGTKAEAQVEIDVEEDEGKPLPAAAKARPWPKALPERIATLREWALQLRSPVAASDAATAFAGARPGDVEPLLDSLAALGLLRSYEAPGGRRWTAAGA